MNFKKYFRDKYVSLTLLLSLLYFIILSYKQYLKLYGLGYPDFDLSIYYQGHWLIAHSYDPFVTIRGLPLLGDHCQLINLFVSPFLLIYDSPLTLLMIETLVIAISGNILYQIAKRELLSSQLSFMIVVAFFLFPALLHHNLDAYRPNTFAIPGFFLMWWAYQKRSLTLLIFGALLTISAKENMATVVAALGIYFLLLKEYRYGWILIGLGLSSFLLITQVFVPYINGGIHYVHASKLQSLKNFLSGKTLFFEYLDYRILTDQNGLYLLKLLLPLGFLPLLQPGLLIFSPVLFANLLVDWPYARMIEYHYSAGLMGAFFIAYTLAIKKLTKTPQLSQIPNIKRHLSSILLIFTLGGFYLYSPSILKPPLLFEENPQIRRDVQEDVSVIREIIQTDSVSASYLLLPFFSDRKEILMWPNPFKNFYYGVRDSDKYPHNPKYLILLKETTTKEHRDMLHPLPYKLIRDFKRVQLYKRIP